MGPQERHRPAAQVLDVYIIAGRRWWARGLNSVYYQRRQRQTDQPARPASTRPPLLLTLLAFVLLRPLARLHEGPPACHPNALLINSILTWLSQGESQEEAPWLRGRRCNPSSPPTLSSHSQASASHNRPCMVAAVMSDSVRKGLNF